MKLQGLGDDWSHIRGDQKSALGFGFRVEGSGFRMEGLG